VLNRKHLGAAALSGTAAAATRLLLRGQTNFVAMPWKLRKVYNAERQHAEHSCEVRYTMRPPVQHAAKPTPAQLYVHKPEGRSARRIAAADGGRLSA
jgi:hypothetical protein